MAVSVVAAENGESDNAIADAITDTINFLNSDKQLSGWNESEGIYSGTGIGDSALHLACWKGVSSQIIERLLELGADVNLKSSGDGYNSLMLASSNGRRNMQSSY